MTDENVLRILINTEGNCNRVTIPCYKCIAYIFCFANHFSVENKDVYNFAVKKAAEMGYNDIVFDKVL